MGSQGGRLMIERDTWGEMEKLLKLSPNLRFTLDWARDGADHRWRAVVYTEKGNVLARGSATKADDVIRSILGPAREEIERRGMGRSTKGSFKPVKR